MASSVKDWQKDRSNSYEKIWLIVIPSCCYLQTASFQPWAKGPVLSMSTVKLNNSYQHWNYTTFIRSGSQDKSMFTCMCDEENNTSIF